MAKYTKEERGAYFKILRDKWKVNKLNADNDDDARAKWQAIQAESPEGRISYYGFYFTYIDMQAQGLDGLPYVDAKTFQGWQTAGFTVKKGEKSKISGITWIQCANKKEGSEDADGGALYPKLYNLFHRSQVIEK